MQSVFIIISSAFALISPVVYIRSILKGESKPHRTTRFVLLLITCLSTAALIAAHDRVAVWLAAVSALQSIMIFGLSLKHGMGGWKKLDITCLLIAVVGIVLWQTTKNPVFALYFAIFADFVGMVPALVKTYRLPETESWLFYCLDVFAAICTLFALEVWRAQDFAYPMYIMIINAIMTSLILFRRKLRHFER